MFYYLWHTPLLSGFVVILRLVKSKQQPCFAEPSGAEEPCTGQHPYLLFMLFLQYKLA